MNESPFRFSRPPTFHVTRWLYHYTSCEKALSNILGPDCTLRLNQLANVNDSRESKFRGFGLYGSGDTNAHYPPDVFRSISNYFRERIKIACFSLDDDRISPDPYVTPEPFVRGYCKPRMWATYGNEHKGVCLVFDRSKLSDAFRQQFPSGNFQGAVHYDRAIQTPNGWFWERLKQDGAWSFQFDEVTGDLPATMARMIDKYNQVYFFSKHEDWIGEREYRLVLHSDSQAPEYLDYGDSLFGLAVGMDCPDSEIEKLVSFANEREIPIVHPDWSIQGWGQKTINKIAKSHV